MVNQSANSKTAPLIITGAGNGTGLVITQHLLERGKAAVGTYRRDYPQLAQLRNQGTDLYYLDCYRRPSGVDAFIAAIRARSPLLRGIIHNASAMPGTFTVINIL